MKTMSKSAKKFFAAAACMSILLVCFAGCNQPNGQQKKSSEKKLLTFKFEAAKNSGVLSQDVAVPVKEKDKTVTLEVPNGTDVKKLVATFTVSKGAKVLVGKAEQKSGETANDFTKLVSYTIQAEDGSTATYKVTVTVLPSTTDPNNNNQGNEGGNNNQGNEGGNNNQGNQGGNNNQGNQGGNNNQGNQGGNNNQGNQGGNNQSTLSSEKKLLTFKFEKANNKEAKLTKDLVGVIDEETKTVTVIVPSDADRTKLKKASFTLSEKAAASINETPQESGVTENDFTPDSISYTVTAEDSSKQAYTVKIETGKAAWNVIKTFSFKQTDNPALSADVEGTILYRKGKGIIFVQFPIGTTADVIKALKPTFTASDKAEVFIGETKLESGVTSADFYNLTDGINITVKAENGDERPYNLAPEIDLPKAEKTAVEGYFGSYYAEVTSPMFGHAKVVVVLEWDKVTLYSTAMSMDYKNMEWEKKDNGTYTCTTYKKEKPQIKNLWGKGGYDFVLEGSDLFVETNIMGAPVKAKKGAAFVLTEGSEYKPVTMHI